MYLGGVIILSTNLAVTAVVVIAAVLFWRAGYFKNVEEPKYRMMKGDEGPVSNSEGRGTNVE